VGRVANSWARFHHDVEERLCLIEGMIEIEVSRTATALGQTNLVLVRAIEDIRVTPTSQSEEGKEE